MKSILFAASCLALATSTASAGQVATVQLSKHMVDSPPRSVMYSRLTNGSSIPAGGSVWPTAIYWTTVEVGILLALGALFTVAIAVAVVLSFIIIGFPGPLYKFPSITLFIKPR